MPTPQMRRHMSQWGGVVDNSANEWNFQFVTTGGDLTVTPVITRHGGAGTATWIWGDGSPNSVGDAPNHTYPGVGTYNVTLQITDIDTALDGINFAGDGLVCTLASLPRGMTWLEAFNEGDCVVSGALANMPAGMTRVVLGGTSSTFTGALTDLPVGMTWFNLGATSVALTGQIADLPAGIIYFILRQTLSTISGALANMPVGMQTMALYSMTSLSLTGGAAVGAAGIRSLTIQDNAMAQVQMESIALWGYTYRASFTFGAPSMNMGGTNDNPGGVYQDASPPTTALERVFKVVNDPDAEGFNKWAWTY